MSRWIFMFLLRSWCEHVISRLESHVSPPGNPPHHHHHQYNQPAALVTLDVCPLPPHHNRHILIYTIFFFFTMYWPNPPQTIFQPAAFVSKQLYLLGCGLFSRIFFIMLSPFIIFWLKNIWDM